MRSIKNGFGLQSQINRIFLDYNLKKDSVPDMLICSRVQVPSVPFRPEVIAMDKRVHLKAESGGSPIAMLRFGRTEIGCKATMLGHGALDLESTIVKRKHITGADAGYKKNRTASARCWLQYNFLIQPQSSLYQCSDQMELHQILFS